jgi:catechol 2,3-dioxygenase-like lactoylglutathione lyase family enzyme
MNTTRLRHSIAPGFAAAVAVFLLASPRLPTLAAPLTSGAQNHCAPYLLTSCNSDTHAAVAPRRGGFETSSSDIAVSAIAITVDDMDRALRFYTSVLPFEKVSDDVVTGAELGRLTGISGARRVARLTLGDERIELVDYLTPGGRPIPADMRSNDRSFQHIAIIVSDMDLAYARLEAAGVEHVSPAPQRLPDWNPNAGGIRAFYFHDPDRHALEILAFPAGKGLEKWHRGGDRLFLGIDHTAIVVGDTARSLQFYRDQLGLRVAGESNNYGIEQERLNNVAGAHLRITGLRGDRGPGIEFLEYLMPRDGRPASAGARADDLAHWETLLAVGSIPSVAQRLRAARALFVSPDVVQLREGRAALVQDPDGHSIRLIEKTS